MKREPLPQSAPRVSEEQQRALLPGAEASRPRDRAMVTLLLYTALRLHELVDLDVGDVSISARKGLLVVGSGKGDAYREVPLNRPCRAPLEDWLKQRAAIPSDSSALFVGPQGRLTPRSVDRVIRGVAGRAGWSFLRKSCGIRA